MGSSSIACLLQTCFWSNLFQNCQESFNIQHVAKQVEITDLISLWLLAHKTVSQWEPEKLFRKQLKHQTCDKMHQQIDQSGFHS